MSTTNLILLFLVTLAGKTFATTGFDTRNPISLNQFRYLFNYGYRFFIGRVFTRDGEYDYTGMQNIKDARAGGFKEVDGYMVPCLKPLCPTAANQVRATIERVRKKRAEMDMLWLGVVRFAWPSDKAHNRRFIREITSKAESMGVKTGIYTNYYNWEEIVGLDWSEMSKYPLWYAHYDGKQDYDDFKPFGGWSKPTMKQYSVDPKGRPFRVGRIHISWYQTNASWPQWRTA